MKHRNSLSLSQMGTYESDDFVTSVKSLNGAVDFAEVLRGWDIVEKIREYQDIFKMGYTFKDEYFVSPIPLVLVSLDPERILMKRPENGMRITRIILSSYWISSLCVRI